MYICLLFNLIETWTGWKQSLPIDVQPRYCGESDHDTSLDSSRDEALDSVLLSIIQGGEKRTHTVTDSFYNKQHMTSHIQTAEIWGRTDGFLNVFFSVCFYISAE